ncbi:hypothetical protein QJS66_13335 [Kocuria rhizophila]|nr:hypothetical protein QJS66_13335 [Kocuria rhizophila]
MDQVDQIPESQEIPTWRTRLTCRPEPTTNEKYRERSCRRGRAGLAGLVAARELQIASVDMGDRKTGTAWAAEHGPRSASDAPSSWGPPRCAGCSRI